MQVQLSQRIVKNIYIYQRRLLSLFQFLLWSTRHQFEISPPPPIFRFCLMVVIVTTRCCGHFAPRQNVPAFLFISFHVVFPILHRFLLSPWDNCRCIIGLCRRSVWYISDILRSWSVHVWRVFLREYDQQRVYSYKKDNSICGFKKCMLFVRISGSEVINVFMQNEGEIQCYIVKW